MLYLTIILCTTLTVFHICNASNELSASPLTKLRTATRCHQKGSTLELECPKHHKIRVIESYYGLGHGAGKNYCNESNAEYANSREAVNDCKSYANFQNNCNGRTVCSISFFETYLAQCHANSNYLSVLYECVPESLSEWGTLKTTNFPKQHNSHEDCWCELAAENNQRIVLSVISFQLSPLDLNCTDAGLYLQSERSRNKECTILHQGHYYISSTKNLYLNFYSKKAIMNGGFWIIYEASDGSSKINLKCSNTDKSKPPHYDLSRLLTTNSDPRVKEDEVLTTLSKHNRVSSNRFDENASILTSSEDIEFNYENLKSESREETLVDEEEIDRNLFFTTISHIIDTLDKELQEESTSRRVVASTNPPPPPTRVATTKTHTTRTTGTRELWQQTWWPPVTEPTTRKPKIKVSLETILNNGIVSYNKLNISSLLIEMLNKKYTSSNPTRKTFFPQNAFFVTNKDMKNWFTQPIAASTLSPLTSTTTLTATKTTSTSTTTRFVQPTHPSTSTKRLTATTTTRKTTTEYKTKPSSTSRASTTKTTTSTTWSTTRRRTQPPTTVSTTTFEITATTTVITKQTTTSFTRPTTRKTLSWAFTDKETFKGRFELAQADIFVVNVTPSTPATSNPSVFSYTSINQLDTQDMDIGLVESTAVVTASSTSRIPTTVEISADAVTTTVAIISSNKTVVEESSAESNQTEYMSSVRIHEDKQFITDVSGSEDESSKSTAKEKKLSKTELAIIIVCVSFVALLILLNLFVYGLKRSKRINSKIGHEVSSEDSDSNKKPYDILPGVGEIVLWAAKDKRGYLIDTNGSWAKIDSQRWLKENVNAIQNSCKKASLACKNKFKKKEHRKGGLLRKLPLKKLFSLPPVSETTEYEITDNTSSASSASSSLNDQIQFIEGDFHTEHGQIHGSYINDQNTLFQTSMNSSPYKLNYMCQMGNVNEMVCSALNENDSFRNGSNSSSNTTDANAFARIQSSNLDAMIGYRDEPATTKKKSNGDNKRSQLLRCNDGIYEPQIQTIAVQPNLKPSDLEYAKRGEASNLTSNGSSSKEILSINELIRNAVRPSFELQPSEKTNFQQTRGAYHSNNDQPSGYDRNTRQSQSQNSGSGARVSPCNTMHQNDGGNIELYQAKMYTLRETDTYGGAQHAPSQKQGGRNDATEQTSFVYQSINAQHKNAASASYQAQGNMCIHNPNFSVSKPSLLPNHEITGAGDVGSSFSMLSNRPVKATTQFIKSRFGSKNPNRNHSQQQLGGGKHPNDSGCILDESKEDVGGGCAKPRGNYSSFSPLNKVTLGHHQQKCAKIKLKKLKNATNAAAHYACYPNDGVAAEPAAAFNDSGLLLDQAKSISLSSPSLSAINMNTPTTVEFDNDESNLMANKEMSWSAEDLDVLKASCESNYAPSPGKSKNPTTAKTNVTTSRFGEKANATTESAAAIGRNDISNSSMSSFVALSKNMVMSSSIVNIINQINSEEVNDGVLIQTLIDKLRETQPDSAHMNASVQNKVESAFPIASLTNDEINKLIYELSSKQGGVKDNKKNRNHQPNDSSSQAGQHISISSCSHINSSLSQPISLARSPSAISSTSSVTTNNNTATQDDVQHYQLDSIDREEDTPIVMNHLHSVKSLKKFFEIKANNRFMAAAAAAAQQQQQVQFGSSLKPSHSMSEQHGGRSSSSNSRFVPPSNDPMAYLNEIIFSRNAQLIDGNGGEPASNASSPSKASTDINNMVPRAPPLPDFFGSNGSKRDSMYQKNTLSSPSSSPNARVDEATTVSGEKQPPPPGIITGAVFNQNIVTQCKQFKLHEKLIREIHHKTLERSKKDVNLSLDKHGNLINRNFVYRADGNLRRFSRQSRRKNNTESLLQSIVKHNRNEDSESVTNEFVVNPYSTTAADGIVFDKSGGPNQQEVGVGGGGEQHRFRAASFRSDFSVRSTGSAYSSRSMLSEAKAKLEAYSGGRTQRRIKQT